MSKKHYIKIAAEIKALIGDYIAERDTPETSQAAKIQCEAARRAIEKVAFRFAVVASDDNPNFDRARFFEACGIVG